MADVRVWLRSSWVGLLFLLALRSPIQVRIVVHHWGLGSQASSNLSWHQGPDAELVAIDLRVRNSEALDSQYRPEDRWPDDMGHKVLQGGLGEHAHRRALREARQAPLGHNGQFCDILHDHPFMEILGALEQQQVVLRLDDPCSCTGRSAMCQHMLAL
eukprot:15025100-Heterocapsa_arctica.AAC.1